jgi:chemotaxis protein MotA
MDKSSFIGLLVGIGGIVAGLLLEGGKISQVVQPTAAIIVFGGTFGAVLLQFPMPVVAAAFRRLVQVFFERRQDPQRIVDQLIFFADKARRNGMVSLDADLTRVPEGFMRKSLMLAVDGTDPQELRKMMQLEIDNQTE